MFSGKRLKQIGMLTMFFFIFFIGAPDLVQAQKEDDLKRAHRLYQNGDYEGSIKLLSGFIDKLRAMVEQKKNVAEAFYLLAKIYFEVGDDSKVEENLMKVFETFPSFQKEESNFSFKDRFERVRKKFLDQKESAADEQQEVLQEKEKEIKKVETDEPGVIVKKKKKKKFPVLLVVGGVAVVALLVLLLTKKKKEDKYDIRGNWRINVNVLGELFPLGIRFMGGEKIGTFIDNEGDGGTYQVDGKSVQFRYNQYEISFTGSFTTKDQMNGAVNVVSDGNNVGGTWNGTRVAPENVASTSSGFAGKSLFKQKADPR